MKKFFVQVLFLVLVILGGLYYSTNFAITGKQQPFFNLFPFFPQGAKTSQVAINGQTLNVEISDTADKRAKGLGGRESLATDSGMLFIFEKPDIYVFWMKGLSFPLDFIWLRDKKVVDVIKNAAVPALGQADSQLPRYVPNQLVDMVLEVNAGFVEANNIQVGDVIEIH